MTPEDITLIRQCLPEMQTLPYYADRESPWLLSQLMKGDTTVAALKSGPGARLLSRPALRALLTQGGGALAHRDVLALAHADRAMTWSGLGRAARAGLDAIYGADWMDFRLSFCDWGTESGWHWSQLSRKGGNLVLQLGFPSDHAALMGRYLPRESRKSFECDGHLVRQEGCPTLAWARLDVDLATGTALIEELQSDWLRLTRRTVTMLSLRAPRSRAVKMAQAYEQALRARYDKLWPRAVLFAALLVLRDQLGCREIFLHQPDPGARLKQIYGRQPPRSLYTALPRSFCFAPTRDVPYFLARNRLLRRLAKSQDGPLFWHLRL